MRHSHLETADVTIPENASMGGRSLSPSGIATMLRSLKGCTCSVCKLCPATTFRRGVFACRDCHLLASLKRTRAARRAGR